MLSVACPDGATAQEVFELDQGQWLKQKVYDPDSPEGQLQTIRKRLAEGKGAEAQKLAEQWIEDHPRSALQPEARLLLGDSKVAQQHYYEALFDYEFLIRAYPATEQFHTALEREYEIANLYIHGMKRLFLGMRILPAEGEGEELLIRIQERAPGSEIGERASLLLGDGYFANGEMTNAADAYDLFLINYPNSLHREWTMLRLIQASLARFKGPPFDPTGLIDAKTRLLQYEMEYPAAAERIGARALLVRIEESLARKDLVTAEWYQLRHENISAAYLYTRLIEEHPATPAAQEAIKRLAALPVPAKARQFSVSPTLDEELIETRDAPTDPINEPAPTDAEPRPDPRQRLEAEEAEEMMDAGMTEEDADLDANPMDEDLP